jgi:GNAT superfamily N-acetyltransferase
MSVYSIRKMTKNEVEIAVDWAEKEGWNPGLHDADLFFEGDQNGFFAGVIDGQIVAVGSAVCYNETYAFCGLYIVHPEHRQKGFGLMLTQARLAYCGDRNIGIDGVLENVDIYQRVGYKPFYMNHRYQVKAHRHADDEPFIKEITSEHMNKVFEYDRQCFPAERQVFLSAWINDTSAKAVAYFNEEQLCGYAVRRQCKEGYKIGPLFADNSDVANKIFIALQQDINGENIILDVPENNPAAIQLANDFNMKAVFATMRMYQNGLPEIAHEKVFGITSFELG